MAIQRSGNFLSQQRLDVPWLKSIESGVTFDFDTLVGLSLSNGGPLVLKGLTLNTTGMIGGLPTNLTLNIAGSVMWNYSASESGSIFVIPEDEPVQQLSSTNSNVLGGFVSGINYVGIDVFKIADPDTTDTVKFIDSDAGVETSQSVPVARTIQYRIVISPQPFSSSKNIVPVAAITVSAGAITKIVDARPMMFRLGSGGEFADAASFFTWGGRTENAITMASNSSPSPFAGEDKSISNLKSWMDSIMTSLWELRGGSAWYSDIYRDHVKLVYGQPVLANGDNVWFLDGVALSLSKSGTDLVTVTLVDHPFTLNSTFELSSVDPNFPGGTYTITNIVDPDTFQYSDGLSTTNTGVGDVINTVAFAGMALLFENSKSALLYKNDIFTGSFVLPDQYCAFVDLTRESSATINPQVRPIYDLSASASPGRRHILCWRDGTYVWCKDKNYEAGRTFLAATTTALGLVKINVTAGTPAAPVVPVLRADGTITVTATSIGTGSGSQFTGYTNAAGDGGAGAQGTGGNSTSGGYGGIGFFGSGGFSTLNSAKDGIGISGFSRGTYGVVGRVFATGTGAGAFLSGQAGAYDVYAWLPSVANAGAVVIGGTNSPGLVAQGGAPVASAFSYYDAFGAIFRGKANKAGTVTTVNGTAPGSVIVNNRYGGVPAIPSSGNLLYLNIDDDNVSGVLAESDGGHTGLLFELLRKFTSTATLMKLTHSGSDTTNPLLHLQNTGNAAATATAIRIQGTNGGTPNDYGVSLEDYAGIQLQNSNNKIKYTTYPTYEVFTGISSASWSSAWTKTSTNFIEGAVMAAGVDPAFGLSFRVMVPRGATVIGAEVIFRNDLASVNLLYRVFTTSFVGASRAKTFKNAGGFSGDAISLGTSVSNQRVALTLTPSTFTVGSTEDFHITFGRDVATTNLEIVGIVVAYTIDQITGALN
jgi:hypothetical protein